MTVAEIVSHVHGGTMSAREIVDGYLARIESADETLGAFLEVFEGDARVRADALDARRVRGDDFGPLGGVPVAIKDNIVMRGRVASCGSRMLEGMRAAYTATVVERLEAAGAIVIGRTNMDEFACGSSTENSAFGVTRHPMDRDRVPGGSSGGSAVAVAAEMVPLAFGSDTGGSIRQPAALCGIVGFKPTYGHVSRYGLIAMASSLDQIGPLGRSVADVATAYRTIAGADARDATSTTAEIAFPEMGPMDMKGLRVGVPKQFFDDALDGEIDACVRGAITRMEQAGANIVELNLSWLEAALAIYYIVMPAEVSSNLNRYDGVTYGHVTTGDTFVQQVTATRRDGFGDEVIRRILLGTFVLSSGYVDAYYKKAVAAQRALRAQLDEAFGRVDVIVGPTSPTVAWPIGEKFDDPVTMYLSDIYTVVANLAGAPALSVPCGMAHGLPVGLQVMGRAGDDARVLDVGYWLEQV